jgi:hypothetical protein
MAATHLSSETLQKYLALQLATKLAEIVARFYPHLLKHCQAIIDRLQPVRCSHHGRKLRAWGRDYKFTADQAPFIRQLVRQHELGLSLELPGDAIANHPAIEDKILRSDGGVYWLQEPDDEAEKPVMVTFASDPYQGLEKEALALAWLTMHPEWTDEQIASKCGISRTTVYKSEKFKAARRALRSARQEFKDWQQFPKSKPRGEKSDD